MSNALSVFQILFTHCLILSFEVKDERIKYIFKKSKQVYWDISFYYSELHTTCNFVFACFSAGKKTHLVLFFLPTSMSDDSSNAPLLYIWYTPPPSMYCVPTFFFFFGIKQCHKQPCCNSNFISTKHLPAIAEAVRVECTWL